MDNETLGRAAARFPVAWRPTIGGGLEGTLDGERGPLEVSLSCELLTESRTFGVRILRPEPLDPSEAGHVGELCTEANRSWPTGGLFVSGGIDGYRIASAGSLRLARYRGPVAPTLVANVLRTCLENAEFAAMLLDATRRGVPIADAIEHGPPDYATEIMRSGGAPAHLLRRPPTPRDDEGLAGAVANAATRAGWPAVHVTTSAIVYFARAVAGRGNGTFVDANDGRLFASTYPLEVSQWVAPARRPAVAELLNRTLDAGVPFGLALDLERGQVRARSNLDLSGMDARPPDDLLCDFVELSAIGSATCDDRIRRVAHEDADPRLAADSHDGPEPLERAS